jgi:serine/threonine protein kinase
MDYANGGSLFDYVQQRTRLHEALARCVLGDVWSSLVVCRGLPPSQRAPSAPAPNTHTPLHCAGATTNTCLRWFFQQLILAVDYCHKKGVANRDIKLENTLLAVRRRLRPVVLRLAGAGAQRGADSLLHPTPLTPPHAPRTHTRTQQQRQMAPGLPRPLVKICDFGYSKHDNRSVARSKVVCVG